MTGHRPDRPRAAGRLRRWGPAALWAVGILTASSWPSPQVPDVRGGDKVVHAAMYAGLAYLAARAALPDARRLVRITALVAAIAAFGAADEWHQRFIPGRSPSAADWVADAVGATVGALAALARRRVQPA